MNADSNENTEISIFQETKYFENCPHIQYKQSFTIWYFYYVEILLYFRFLCDEILGPSFMKFNPLKKLKLEYFIGGITCELF